MNFIIDGHAFLNVALNVTKSIYGKFEKFWVHNLLEDRDFLKEEVKIEFKNFCYTYLRSLIYPIKNNLSQLHIVLDSKSWRKDYVLEYLDLNQNIDEFQYKGTRKYDNNHYLFFEYFYNTLIPIFEKECSINIHKVENAEGDDLITYLCENLKSDCLVYTVDGDLKQLLHTPNKNIAILFPKQISKSKKVFINTEYHKKEKSIELDSFFDLDESDISSSFSSIINEYSNKGFKKIKINPNIEFLEKIILGDKSDNIPRLLKMTPNKFNKILPILSSKFGENNFIDLIDNNDSTFIQSIIEECSKLFKSIKIDQDSLRSSLFLNISIIRLKTNVFPNQIRESIDNHFTNTEFSNFNFNRFNNLKNNLSRI